MNIRTQQNILLTQYHKRSVSKISNSGINNTKSSVSFKAIPSTLITEADKKIINIFSQHYGGVAERLGRRLAELSQESDVLRRNSRFVLEKGVSSIKEKSIGKLLIENIVFPFTTLPRYGISWVLKLVQKKFPNLKDGARKIYNTTIIRTPRKINDLDSKTDMLKGMYDKTTEAITAFVKEKGFDAAEGGGKEGLQRAKDRVINMLNNADDSPEAKQASEYVKEYLYKVSNKFFDKGTGNYNTAYERPLNRIVTGLIPAAFLANDAYNLSVMCGDTKEMSKKEAKDRKKQEISRVFTTAYIQLLTFGAFTKQVNTTAWFAPVASGLTVLLSETLSRKRLGKPIFFLSKEKAKQYNLKNKNKTPQNDNKTNTIPEKEKQIYADTNLGGTPRIFTSFGASEVKENLKTNSNTAKKEKETEKDQPKKALLNFKTIGKLALVALGAGVAINFIKNSTLTGNTKPVKAVKNLFKTIKEKIYNPLAFKDFQISQEEFDKITSSLNSADCKEIAQGHEFIKSKYGRVMADGTIKIFKSKIPSSKVSSITTSVIEDLRNNGVSLSEKELSNITESMKTVLKTEPAAIAENKFGKIASKFMEVINAKGIKTDSSQTKNLTESIAKILETNSEAVPMQVETKLKPFVDIVTEPFKFIMSIVKKPYEGLELIVKTLTKPITKKAAKAELGQAELKNYEKIINSAVKQVFGEKAVKEGKISQKIFVNAIEKLNKQTLPYRKAKEALNNAISEGLSPQKIEEAKKALNKAEKNLEVYVKTAVEKSFNGVTQSSNSNTELAMMVKLASSLVTSVFLVADNYNMVMIKSDGEDKKTASEKARERVVQRLSALFYQTMLIHWFNSTFSSIYHGSLPGMAAVASMNTVSTEVLTRKSIGMPIKRKTYEELQEIDEKNENRKGFIGKYFQFMRLLTGKKPLRDRMPVNKSDSAQNTEKFVPTYKLNPDRKTTNLIELYTK